MELYAAHTHRSRKTVSRLATGSGETITRLIAGHTITLRRLSRAMQYLSNNWPPGLAWPADIPRPLPTPDRDHPQEAA